MRITIIEEEFITGVSLNRKGNLGYGDCQTILLIPLKVKLQALEYRRRLRNPLLDKQLALG